MFIQRTQRDKWTIVLTGAMIGKSRIEQEVSKLSSLLKIKMLFFFFFCTHWKMQQLVLKRGYLNTTQHWTQADDSQVPQTPVCQSFELIDPSKVIHNRAKSVLKCRFLCWNQIEYILRDSFYFMHDNVINIHVFNQIYKIDLYIRTNY